MKQLLPLFCLILIWACSTTEEKQAPVPGPANHSIINGDFSAGSLGWSLWHDSSAKASFKVENQQAELTIENAGKRTWSIVFSSSGLLLEKDHMYTVRFSACSNSGERIHSGTAMSRKPNYGYSGNFHFYPSEQMQDFSFSFTMRQESDRNSSFYFQLGGTGQRTVRIDNISIEHLGPAPEPVIASDFPKPLVAFPRRGIQFGLNLASPFEGTHVPELTESYFDAIAQDGRFDHIRIPVWWEYHTDTKPPFTIDPGFMKRVEWAAAQSLKRGYYTIVNMHWFRALEQEPKKNKARLLATWKQIAEHFRDYPDNLWFDIFNEPNGNLDRYWNKYAIELYDLIRSISPERTIIISGTYWAHMSHIPLLKLPERIKNDPDVLIQFHSYIPGDFCFQGSAGNGPQFADSKQIRWTGTAEEKQFIRNKLDTICSWAAENGVRLYNGEFTAMASGESLKEDRHRWIRFITTECEKRNIPWNYYDFSEEDCYVFDTALGQWNEELMDVLFGK